MKFELTAELRSLQGSGASRRLRLTNKVPGIIYGGTKAPTVIELDHNKVFLSLRKPGFRSSMLSVKVGDVVETVLLRDAQMHPFKAQVLHVDFLRVNTKEVISQKIPLHLINADIAPGIKIGGGMISQTLTEIEVSCLPQDLPSFIEVDLTDLELGKNIHLSEIKFPDNVKAVLAHGAEDAVVVSISAKKSAAADMAADAAEAEASAASAAASATPSA